MFFQKDAETMSRKQIEEIQLNRLKWLVDYCCKNIPFYHDRLEKAGVTAEKIKTLDKFKDKKASKLVDAIKKSKGVKLANFIYALGIDNVGSVTAKELAEKFGSVDALRAATKEQLLEIDDVGEIVAESITEWFSEPFNGALTDRLKAEGIDPHYENKTVRGAFSGKRVVLTGSLENFTRSKASELIEERG